MASKRYEPEEIVGMPVRRRARDRAVPVFAFPAASRRVAWGAPRPASTVTEWLHALCCAMSRQGMRRNRPGQSMRGAVRRKPELK